MECHRLDMRIDHAPLPRPVSANSSMTVNCAAFHAIWPFHVGLHGGQGAVDIPGVERLVRPSDELNAGCSDHHCASIAMTFVCFLDLRFHQEFSIPHNLLVVHPDIEFPPHSIDMRGRIPLCPGVRPIWVSKRNVHSGILLILLNLPDHVS